MSRSIVIAGILAVGAMVVAGAFLFAPHTSPTDPPPASTPAPNPANTPPSPMKGDPFPENQTEAAAPGT